MRNIQCVLIGSLLAVTSLLGWMRQADTHKQLRQSSSDSRAQQASEDAHADEVAAAPREKPKEAFKDTVISNTELQFENMP